jgi:glucose/mannose-6-phosphate isomerase
LSGQPVDEAVDDLETLHAGDAGGMLPAVAGSAAQVREAATLAAEAGFEALADGPPPRAIVVTGMGGSAISGDVLAALLADGPAVPVVVHRGYGLPPWVSALDLVVAVSCSGRTEETLSAAEEARRRGVALIGIGAGDSPLQTIVERGRGLHVPVDVAGRMPRASLWSLAVPLLVAVDRLGLHPFPAELFEAAARRLEAVASACRPDSDLFINPAKELAVALSGSLPMIWGTSAVTGVAARRLASQLAENAKYPAVHGVLPEANHNQVVVFDGPFAGAPDRFADAPDQTVRLRLVLIRDQVEHPQVTRRAEASAELAAERGVALSTIEAVGASPLERLACAVCLGDYVSVYLALGSGLDPTPIEAIEELKSRIAGPADRPST